MKLADVMVLADTKVGALLRDATGWAVWQLGTVRRRTRDPAFLAAHRASPLLIAVYVRMHRPLPSEWPATEWLPPAVVPVVWHPAISGPVRRWLADPSGDPPGTRGDNTPEHSVWMEPLMLAGRAPRTELEAFALRKAHETGWTPRHD